MPFSRAVANGGKKYRPYFGKDIIFRAYGNQTLYPEERDLKYWSNSLSSLVQEGLQELVLKVPAAAMFKDFPVPIGKTGTAENSHGRDHGWFVAYYPFW